MSPLRVTVRELAAYRRAIMGHEARRLARERRLACKIALVTETAIDLAAALLQHLVAGESLPLDDRVACECRLSDLRTVLSTLLQNQER